MQFSSVATQDQTFFAQKAVDPATDTAKQGRAELTAALLQRVATEVSIAAAAQQRRNALSQPAGAWITPGGRPDDAGEGRLPGDPTIAALLRAVSRTRHAASALQASAGSGGRRRPMLNNKLQKLVRTLSDDDLAVAVGQVKVLAKARNRAA